MYTHKKFFVAAGLSGLWFGAIELAGYLGWHWLVVVLLAVPCVMCFGLWMRLEDERELCRMRDLKPTTYSVSDVARGIDELSKLAQVPKICRTCVLRQRCDSDDDLNSCDEWGGEYSWENK